MPNAPRVLGLSEKCRDYTASNLSELVRIKSPSLGEKAVAAKLAEQMQAARFDAVEIDGLGNVIGRIGNGRRILAFDGHIDTVEVGNAAGVFERYRIPTYIQAGFKPYVIAAVMLAARFEDPVKLLRAMKRRASGRTGF